MIHLIAPLSASLGVHYLGFQRDPEGNMVAETVGTRWKREKDKGEE